MDQIYELPPCATVEIKLKNICYKGEFTLIMANGMADRNSELDKIQLEDPIELPSGKQLNQTVIFAVKDIISLKVVEYGIFKKKRDCDEINLPVSAIPTKNSLAGQDKCVCGKTKNMRERQDMKDVQPVEIILRTFVITEESKLKVLMRLLKTTDACGLSLEGKNIGRHGMVTWLILTAGKTLLPLDLDSLVEKIPNLWKVLETGLFCNSKLVKIFHDSRPAADYLFHVHKINMVNVFGTQVADALVYQQLNKTSPSQLNPLSDCLELYNRRIPVEEIEFLRKFESQLDSDSPNSPMLKKPFPDAQYLKLCALKVKHLIPLRENLMRRLSEKLNRCTQSHMDSYLSKTTESYSSLAKDTKQFADDELLRILEEDSTNA